LSIRTDRLERSFEAFNRGDFDALREFAADEIELRTLTAAEPVRGVDAIVDWFRPDAFEEQAIETRDIREHGDAVYVELEIYGRGAASGVEVRQPGYVVYEFDGDLITRLAAYPDREAALAAAGLAG
jgi:ketosteroid isomerase-like protein